MKAILALAATIGAAAASGLHARHEGFHNKRWASPSGYSSVPSYFQPECCQNIVTVTVYGTMSAAPAQPTSQQALPTPFLTTCPTPGTYTIPEATVTVSSTHTVVIYTTKPLTPGTNQYGGYTTSVTAPTTVTCPYVVQTSVITTTTYVCPSAGQYTIVPPTETVCSTSTVVVYPVPATITPGTYTRQPQTVTATVTDYVYVCPFEENTTTVQSTSTITVTATRSSSAVATVTATGQAPPAPASQNSAPASSAPASSAPAPAPQYSAPASSAPASSAPAPASSSPAAGTIKPNGNQWAVTYTPYTTSGQCKTADEVDVDISLIATKGFTTVRLYATDCSGLQNVGQSCKNHGLKIIIGVFIESSGISGAQSQVTDIVAWGSSGFWSIVELVVVGNEAIFNNYCSASDLAGFISSCKSAFSNAGYTGPVTTTEPLGTLQSAGSSLCAVVDVVAANLQPFFNADVVAESAGDFVASQLDLVAAVCPGKTAYNLECGWPSAGSNNGKAQPGTQQQKDAITDIVSKAGGKTVLFSFANDQWKAEGQFGVEQSFGCIDLF